MSVKELSNNTKIGAAVAAGTAGIGATFAWIPSDIGQLATVLGIVLSSVLIFNHLKNGIMERKKIRLEIQILREKNGMQEKTEP